MGPTACQLSVNLKLLSVSRTIFRHCQLSVKPKSQIQGLSVVSKTSCQLSVKNMDDCQLSVTH